MFSISQIVGYVLLVALVAGLFLLFRGGSSSRRHTPQASRSAGAQPWDADGASGRGNR